MMAFEVNYVLFSLDCWAIKLWDLLSVEQAKSFASWELSLYIEVNVNKWNSDAEELNVFV